MKKRYLVTINRYDTSKKDYVFYQDLYFTDFIYAQFFTVGFGIANDIRFIDDAMRPLYQVSPIKRLKGGVLQDDKDTK